MSDCSFTQCVLNSHRSGNSVVWLPHETVAVSAQVLCTPRLCTSLQCHFIWSHIHRLYVCVAETCYLHFWQNDWDILHAAAVTQGWNRYWSRDSTESWPSDCSRFLFLSSTLLYFIEFLLTLSLMRSFTLRCYNCCDFVLLLFFLNTNLKRRSCVWKWETDVKVQVTISS